MKKYPFSFHPPTKAIGTIRDIVYGRKVEGVQDNEDKVSVLCELVEQAMREAFLIGQTLGVEEGVKYNR